MAGEQDGVTVYVQTDHRSPAEMDETPEVSVLFALVRTLLPRRLACGGKPEVRYAADAGASAGVAEAVAATGAQVETMASGSPEVIPFVGVARTAAEVADEAFSALAHRVARRERLSISDEGLAAFEQRLRARGLDPDDSSQEHESWTAVMELAAFAGECLRGEHAGGHWALIDGDDDVGLLPLTFVTKDGTVHDAANMALQALTEHHRSTVQLLGDGDGLARPLLGLVQQAARETTKGLWARLFA